jgi:hypothetical protein
MHLRVAASLVAALLAAPALAVDIRDCGADVPAGETGVLVADIVCSGPGTAVQLHDRSTLDLAGHSITGGTAAVQGSVSLRGRSLGTHDRCRVRSSRAGGAIVGSLFGVNNCAKLEVSDVEIVGAKLQAVGGARVVLTNVVLRDGGASITAGAVTARNLTIVSNGGVAQMRGAAIKGLTATGNRGAWVLQTGTLDLEDAVVTGNDGVGIIATKKVRVVDGTIAGNDSAGAGIDIESAKRPRLRGSTCGRSERFDVPGSSWGVCTQDPP